MVVEYIMFLLWQIEYDLLTGLGFSWQTEKKRLSRDIFITPNAPVSRVEQSATSRGVKRCEEDAVRTGVLPRETLSLSLSLSLSSIIKASASASEMRRHKVR